MYHFISGYTAKVAGTERGVTEPTATFSPCFGGPFLTLHPLEYAELLRKKMNKFNVPAFLVNTGWVGASAESGAKRISLPITRKIISKTLRFILKHLIRLPVSDTQCGLKGFNELGKQLLLETKINTYLFDLELVLLSRKNKLKISAVHVFLKEGVIFTRMKASILIKEALNFFRLMKIK